jgi:hypothetical protein
MSGNGKQGSLEFGAAEGAFQERLNMLNLALSRIQADIYVCRLCERVYYFTHGGVSGESLVKTYDELASRPLWLCCSRSKARHTVGLARHRGLLAAAENRYATGGQKANGYRIDWQGVRAILHGGRGGSQARPRSEDRATEHGSGEARPGVSPEHPPVLLEQGGALPEAPPCSIETPLLSNNSSLSFSKAPSPVPDPDPERGALWKLPVELSVIPELAEACEVPVDPLPPGKLVYGVWSPLVEKHLRAPASMLVWYRRQLSVPDPWFRAANLAEGILIAAAGIYASRASPHEIRKTRVALFVHTATYAAKNGDWRRVLRYVPAAAAAIHPSEVSHG